jgi:N-acetylmuramoyl-L-alanine amidase
VKIAIDPGHGMNNSLPGVFDPGATKTVNGVTFAEADVVLRYGLTLKEKLESQNIPFFMTRSSSANPAPVGGRANRAKNAGCTHFVSLHLNSAGSHTASGIEVLFRDDNKDRALASWLQQRLIQVTNLKDRGIKKRADLAVLKFSQGPAVLIELGFISNDGDRDFVILRENRLVICQAIMDVLTNVP